MTIYSRYGFTTVPDWENNRALKSHNCSCVISRQRSTQFAMQANGQWALHTVELRLQECVTLSVMTSAVIVLGLD